MSKLAELGTLSCEQSAEQTIWRIEWHESVKATLSFVSVAPLRPLRGLLYSLGLHVCVIAAAGYFQWWSFLLPPQRHLPQQEEARVEYEPIYFNQLPALGGQSGSAAGIAGNAQSSKKNLPDRAADREAERIRQEPTLPKTKAVYAGPQEIISNPPDAINVVQTIRRPDLVAPPKLKFPIRVQSMVMLPPPAAMPSLRAPAAKRPASGTVVEIAPRQILEKPVLPIPLSTQPSAMVAQQLANVASPAPQLAPTPAKAEKSPMSVVDSSVTNEKAAIVLNAVTLPPDAPAAIPNGEISGSFAVIGSGPARVAEAAASPQAGGSGTDKGLLQSRGSGARTGTSGDHGGTSGRIEGRGTGTLADGNGPGGKGNSGQGGSSRGVGNGSAGSGASTVESIGSGRGSGKSFSGITIIGGGTDSGLHIPAIAPRRRPTYGLTIISGGASGATNDLGVFERSETVYTVYIPMSDAGGGVDWPMQYALAGSVAAGNGLLSPPLATKKVPAVSPADPPLPRSGRIFLSGIISATGELKNLRAVRPEELGSQTAIDALRQWQFAPAEINGQPVATKVLIGVAITNPMPK